MSRIAVTGAAGFIGRAVVREALARGHDVVAVVRAAPPEGTLSANIEVRAVGDLREPTAQTAAAEGCEAVIHLAARSVSRDERAHAAEFFRAHNELVTAGLAEAAVRAGCRRFVLASSLKVYASTTPDGAVLTDDAAPAPDTAYGASKLAAEARLADIAGRAGLSAIALRPPAVYGPGAGASQLGLLMRMVQRGLPMPLASVKNRRSFIYSENFAAALVKACESKVTGSFIVTDSAPLSSRELVERIAFALGVKPRLVPAPVGLMRALASAGGSRARQMADSLLGSMAVDGTPFCDATGWEPSVDPQEAMARTARAYLAAQGSA